MIGLHGTGQRRFGCERQAGRNQAQQQGEYASTQHYVGFTSDQPTALKFIALC